MNIKIIQERRMVENIDICKDIWIFCNIQKEKKKLRNLNKGRKEYISIYGIWI